ncbi:MAG: hypothetical protein JSR45_11475 [Proteobacteria bacterium]|nr:hypothetical protein [Pseudomonadota bacterium]
MTRSSLSLLALTAALALGPVAASAQDAAPAAPEAQPAGAVVRSLGLIGRWAGDCAKPATLQNSYAVYAANYSGAATLTYDRGKLYEPRIYDLSNAHSEDAGRVLYDEVSRTSQARITIALLRDGDRIRVWSSVGVDGKALVVDGKLADDSGAETPWLSRCPLA